MINELYISSKIREVSCILLILGYNYAFANMAEPVVHGTLGSRPFTSQFVDVLHESLSITIDKGFNRADFDITYHIKSSKDGFQIPLLFYASELFDSFKVSIDGKKLELKEARFAVQTVEETKFKDFAYFFESSSYGDENQVLIEEAPNSGFYVDLNNMLYFETDFSEGEHQIQVSYRASAWTDGWDWVNEYSFRYALSPAKYWKSFGTLDLTVDATQCSKPIRTNVGPPHQGTLDSIAHWRFDQMPTEILYLDYIPVISKKAKFLIKLKPEGLAILTGLFLILLHFWLTVWYRKKFPEKKYSVVVILGSIVVPLLFLLSWIMYYDFIDYMIGGHASGHHGYLFFIVFLYPFVLVIYWLVFWLVDRRMKKTIQT